MDATVLVNTLNSIVDVSHFTIPFAILLLLVASSLRIDELQIGDDNDNNKVLGVLSIASIVAVLIVAVSIFAPKVVLDFNTYDVEGSDKKYLASQIEFSNAYRQFTFEDGCYVGSKGNLTPGDAVILQTKGTKIWTKLQDDKQTLQEVEYIVASDKIFGPYSERMVDLLQFNLSDFKECELKPDWKEKQQLEQQKEFDKLNNNKQNSEE